MHNTTCLIDLELFAGKPHGSLVNTFTQKLDGLIFPSTRSLLPQKQFCKVFCTKVLVDNKAKGRTSKRWLQVRKRSTPVYLFISGEKKIFFFGKFDVLCFVTTVLRIVLSPYYRRIVDRNQIVFG